MMNTMTTTTTNLDTTRAFFVAAATRRGLAPATATYLGALVDHLDRRDALLPPCPRSVFRSGLARAARDRFTDAVVGSMSEGDTNWIV